MEPKSATLESDPDPVLRLFDKLALRRRVQRLASQDLRVSRRFSHTVGHHLVDLLVCRAGQDVPQLFHEHLPRYAIGEVVVAVRGFYLLLTVPADAIIYDTCQ